MSWDKFENYSKINNKNELKGFFERNNLPGKLGRYEEAIEWFDRSLELDLEILNSLKETSSKSSNSEFDLGETKYVSLGKSNRNSLGCPNCGKNNPFVASFCNGCGRKLGRRCSECNEINQLETSFCNFCGYILE
jgi:tetratricopeptide (TPR) repeat protein